MTTECRKAGRLNTGKNVTKRRGKLSNKDEARQSREIYVPREDRPVIKRSVNM